MLQDNDLSGPLPSAWGNRNQFTALTYLDLSGEDASELAVAGTIRKLLTA